ncbi:MAG TPA: tetratricopeptide repeat protein [Gammaproteobacteria bacterium]|nr:tetratricopeptide repeat protein [Gammaproteobacteria bacterium]
MHKPPDSTPVDELLALARKCREQDDAWQAIEHCRTVLSTDEHHAEALALLGQCLAATGDLPNAGNYLSRAIELNPKRADAYLHLGEVNARMGRAQEALRCFQHAVQLQPDDINILNGFAVALWGMGQLDEARSLLERAIGLEPENAFSRRNLQLLSSRLVDRWHFAMVNDVMRNQQFEAALKRAIRQDSVVLDIGAGTGLLSMMAARAGARQVIACEANPALAELAREVIKSNGYSDRIRVINKASQQLIPATDFQKNTRPDVLVAEVFDTLVIGEGALATFAHARRYLLAPDAVAIPGRAVLYGGLIESERLWREGGADQASGFDLTPLNRFRPDTIALEATSFSGRLLADEFTIFSFDFTGSEPTPERVHLDIPVRESGICHALVYWIRLQLDDEAAIDNRPAFDGETTGSNYCAHWYQVAKLLVPPLSVSPGMTVRIEARHNRQNVAVVIYDPVTGEPLD